MKRTLLIICLFISGIIFSQIKGTPVSIGTNYTISSKILNQERGVQIYLPDSYATSTEKYPVLYLLDGQRFFANGVAIQKSLKAPLEIPEMIIVGINSSRELRRNLYNTESTKFTSFIKNEVVSFLDSNFRTTKERVIFGWEAAAYYISKMILKETDLFSGAIISDGGLASEDAIKEFKSDKEIYLFIANSKRDIFYIASTEKFNERLKKHNPKNLRWKYELFNEEVHQTMPHLALYKGLNYYYHNYPELIFENLQAYNDAGGMHYLKSYAKERAKRFGGDGKIDNATKNRLIWLSENHDNFNHFKFFMEAFKDVLSTKRYASANWQNRLGQFYLKYKDYKNAISFFETGIKKYPNTQFDERMRKGLKEAKENLNEHKK